MIIVTIIIINLKIPISIITAISILFHRPFGKAQVKMTVEPSSFQSSTREPQVRGGGEKRQYGNGKCPVDHYHIHILIVHTLHCCDCDDYYQ